jgi:type II secretory pathway pseudopilin PulG
MNFRSTHDVRRRALTLLEMMVAVTLLALIMIGLLAMFNQTQKALHTVNAQTDVFENARGAIQMIARDLAEMSFYDDGRVPHKVPSAFANIFPSPIPSGSLPTPQPAPNDVVPVFFAETYWLKHVNDDWQPVGYFVVDDPVQRTNYGVGTLYRFSTNTANRAGVSFDQVPALFSMFNKAQATDANVVHRVSDGIVHFQIAAVSVETNLTQTNFVRTSSFIFTETLPAFIDVEIGVLEPQVLKQFHSIKDLSLPAAKDFLQKHSGQIHFFRERVPIRNFVNPYRANEVP